MELKKPRGQALVEFSLTIPILLMMLLFMIDPALYLFNHAVGAYYTFKAAREASIFLADGTTTCYRESREAAFGGLGGTPVLFMVDLADTTQWSLTVEPCPDNSSWSPSSGYFVTASFVWHQGRIFWGTWDGSISLEDVFQ